jgi:ribosomal protein S11
MAKQIEKQLKNEDSETTKSVVHIQSTFNTIVTITNLKESYFWSGCGFKGS